MLTCLNTLHDTNRVVKPQFTEPALGAGKPRLHRYTGTLIRAERNAWRGSRERIYRESRGEVKSLPGIPKTNSKPFASSEGFSICGAVRWLLPRVGTSSKEYPGP